MCDDINKEFIILKEENIKEPKICKSEYCSRKIIGGYCVCHLKIYNIRPHTFEIIGAIKPFFEMVAISRLSFIEV
jgi:hypothetical protein